MTPAEILYARRVLTDATGKAEDWRPTAGGIVAALAEATSRGRGIDAAELAYYGGALVCESMAARDALAACVAVEMLPKAMTEIERLRGAGRLQLARG